MESSLRCRREICGETRPIVHPDDDYHPTNGQHLIIVDGRADNERGVGNGMSVLIFSGIGGRAAQSRG